MNAEVNTRLSGSHGVLRGNGTHAMVLAMMIRSSQSSSRKKILVVFSIHVLILLTGLGTVWADDASPSPVDAPSPFDPTKQPTPALGEGLIKSTDKGSITSASIPFVISAREQFTVGKPTQIEGKSPCTSFSLMFEDDGRTGYLYGMDVAKKPQPILDAVNIYNVGNVLDRAVPSEVAIIWTKDGLRAALLINDYPHAVFDFIEKRAYCRTNFPPPDDSWTKYDHQWDDKAMVPFKLKK